MIFVGVGMPLKVEILDAALLHEFAELHRNNYPADHLSGALDHNLLVKYYSYFSDDDCQSYIYRDKVTKEVKGFIVTGARLGPKIKKFTSSERIPLLIFFFKNPLVLLKIALKKIAAIFRLEESFSECECLILSIVSDSQCKGVGSALLGALFADAINSGRDKIGLYVTCTNTRAINFYFHRGFRIVAYCKGQYYMEHSLIEV